MEPLVAVVMGSESERGYREECTKILEKFSIPYEVKVLSAHRTPEETRKYAQSLKERGVKIVIAGAGKAAHLPGFIASFTPLPVIGVPLPSPPFQGIDALLSITQMPGGVPVAGMGIGKSGAQNAALFSLRLLSLFLPEVEEKLKKT